MSRENDLRAPKIAFYTSKDKPWKFSSIARQHNHQSIGSSANLGGVHILGTKKSMEARGTLFLKCYNQGI